MQQHRNSFSRELSECIRLCMCIACGIRENKYKQPKFIENSIEDSIYYRLIALVDDGEFNEAENIMLENLEPTDINDYYTMLCIYDYMNDFDDAFMEQNNFSREEIQEGVKAISCSFDMKGIYTFLYSE